NREVKPGSANGTATRGRVGRRLSIICLSIFNAEVFLCPSISFGLIDSDQAINLGGSSTKHRF
ncbi:hypothetical protein WJR50_28295, partial [Catalinimonas sp. 4WD22]|uniref:hypothetical protein n=1 Tax=Catalinimonas locisalis TaxID=3133978 RepID=UPI00310108B9